MSAFVTLGQLRARSGGPYGSLCPTCGRPAVGATKCIPGEYFCAGNHHWSRGLGDLDPRCSKRTGTSQDIHCDLYGTATHPWDPAHPRWHRCGTGLSGNESVDVKGMTRREIFDFLDSPPHGQGGAGTFEDPQNLDAEVPDLGQHETKVYRLIDDIFRYARGKPWFSWVGDRLWKNDPRDPMKHPPDGELVVEVAFLKGTIDVVIHGMPHVRENGKLVPILPSRFSYPNYGVHVVFRESSGVVPLVEGLGDVEPSTGVSRACGVCAALGIFTVGVLAFWFGRSVGARYGR